MLKEEPKLRLLMTQLEYTTHTITEYERIIKDAAGEDANARLIDTIPGIGKVSVLIIASEIGDVNRFPSEENIFAYTGLVPRVYQSGNKEWRGHITKGNGFLKWTLVECVGIHIMNSADSPITTAYRRIRERRGNKKQRSQPQCICCEQSIICSDGIRTLIPI